MSKIYHSTKTGLVVASGTLKSIAADGMSVVIASGRNVKKGDEYKFEQSDITARVNLPVEGYTIGAPITAAGYQAGPDTINADMCACGESAYVPLSDKVAVLSGEVLFTGYRDEIDRETGSPRLTKAGSPRKPHYDISVSVGSGQERVLHTVRLYGEDDIKSAQNRFKNFDRKENPMYATIVTQPGDQYTTTNERNGRTYTNTNMSHMGASSMDLIFTKERVKAKDAPAQDAAQKAAAPAQTVAQEAPAAQAAAPSNGFNIDDIDIDGLDGLDMDM